MAPTADAAAGLVGTIRYWAAAKAAAGTAEEPCTAARSLAEVLAAARRRHAGQPDFARVLTRCSFLVDGHPVGTRDHAEVPVPGGAVIEVLPPFAGGAA